MGLSVEKLKKQQQELTEQRRQLEGQHAFVSGRIEQLGELIKEAEAPPAIEAEAPETETAETETKPAINGGADADGLPS